MISLASRVCHMGFLIILFRSRPSLSCLSHLGALPLLIFFVAGHHRRAAISVLLRSSRAALRDPCVTIIHVPTFGFLRTLSNRRSRRAPKLLLRHCRRRPCYAIATQRTLPSPGFHFPVAGHLLAAAHRRRRAQAAGHASHVFFFLC